MAKPSAASRTVDMFSLPPKVTATPQEASTEDAKEAEKPAETIEQIAERGREKAFETSEYLSKKWGQVIDGGTYRLTVRGDLMLLEQFRHNGKETGAYGWTGIMFPKSDLLEVTMVFVNAAREMKKNG